MTRQMTGEFDKLFRPSSVALIGASAKPGKIGNIIMRNLLKGDREVYAVNPGETEILGRKCYSTVNEVPGVIDMAMVTLPANVAVGAVRECVAKGVQFVVVSSSGFRESGEEGRGLERELYEVVRGTDTRILGPNSMGVLVPSASLDTLFIPEDRSLRPGRGSVAVISQSGAVAVAFLERAAASGLGISACVCVGNKCDVDELELLQHFGEDPDTKCIAMYLESFSRGRRFVEESSRVSDEKPTVVLKSGRTSAGAQAAGLHTGAIASSSDRVVDGVLRQAGVARVGDEEALIDVSRAFSVLDHLQGGRVCAVASAGGFGVIASDLIESESVAPSLRMAILSEETTSALSEILPSFASARNPVDLTASVTDEMYDGVLGALQRDPGVDAVLMSLELQPPSVTPRLIEIAARRSSSPPPIVASMFARDQSIALEEAAGMGLLAYPTLWRSVRALDALAMRGSHLNRSK